MNLKNLSIKTKLLLITMLTSSVALVLLSASYLGYDLISPPAERGSGHSG